MSKVSSAFTSRPFEDVFWFQEGPGVRKWQFHTEGIKLLNVANIEKQGRLNLAKTDRHLDVKEARGKYAHFLLDEGDLVIASSGISFDEDGLLRTRGAFVESEHLPLCLNTSTIRFKPKDGQSDLNFLRHWLNGLEFRAQITKLVTGSAQQNFGPSHLKALSISIPQPEEQRRIAAILDQAETLRTQRRAALAQLDGLTQALFLDMFSAALASKDRVSMGELVSEFRYGTSEKSGDSGFPALRIPNVASGALDLNELKTVVVEAAEFERLRLVSGDLLFVRTNGNPDYVGRCAVFEPFLVANTDFEPTEFIYASYLIRARLKGDDLLPLVLQYYLSEGEGRRALRARCKTSAGQYNINTVGLGSIPIPLFPLALQQTFATRIQAIESLKTTHRTALTELDALFASLQQRAFAGEL